MNHQSVAIDLFSRSYPDTTGTALRHLKVIEQVRKHPGFENYQRRGHAPCHEQLEKLGLVVIGAPCASGLRPVELTEDGRIVASMLDGLYRGYLHPVRCRCCGNLIDGEDPITDLCWGCNRLSKEG